MFKLAEFYAGWLSWCTKRICVSGWKWNSDLFLPTECYQLNYFKIIVHIINRKQFPRWLLSIKHNWEYEVNPLVYWWSISPTSSIVHIFHIKVWLVLKKHIHTDLQNPFEKGRWCDPARLSMFQCHLWTEILTSC